MKKGKQPYELFEKETQKRLEHIADLFEISDLEREWKNLTKDEASRNHFLRLVFACGVSVGVMRATGNPIKDEEKIREGAMSLIRHITKAAVVQDYLDGKLK